jgi:hypothetical protein
MSITSQTSTTIPRSKSWSWPNASAVASAPRSSLYASGMVVHGFGVPHAHLLLVPQQGIHHITSDRYASVENGQLVFSQSNVATPDRATLDEHARVLAVE